VTSGFFTMSAMTRNMALAHQSINSHPFAGYLSEFFR
jgi:hypothetical protein